MLKVYVCSEYPFHSLGGIKQFGKELKFNRGILATDNEKEQAAIESDILFGNFIKISPEGAATPAPIVNSHLGMVSAKPFTDEHKEHAVMGNPEPKVPAAPEVEFQELNDFRPNTRILNSTNLGGLREYVRLLEIETTGEETREQLRDLIVDKMGR